MRTITSGFQSVKPTYSVSAAENGTVELLNDGSTARFIPKANFNGLASFKYTVKGNDNTEYTGRVEVLVEKGAAGTQDSVDADSSTVAIHADNRKISSYNLATTPTKFRIFNLQGMVITEMESSVSNLQADLKAKNLQKGIYIAKPLNAKAGFVKLKN